MLYVLFVMQKSVPRAFQYNIMEIVLSYDSDNFIDMTSQD